MFLDAEMQHVMSYGQRGFCWGQRRVSYHWGWTADAPKPWSSYCVLTWACPWCVFSQVSDCSLHLPL